MIVNEKTLSEKNIYDGNIIKVKVQKVSLLEGKTGTREIVRHPGGVGILAFKDKNTILMVKQFRKPIEKAIYEIPAGKLEPNEDIEKSARRELKEETGYTSNKFEYMGKIVSSPGFCDEYIHLFKAEELTPGETDFDDGEFIDLYEVSIDDAKKMVKDGQIIDAKTICALMMGEI